VNPHRRAPRLRRLGTAVAVLALAATLGPVGADEAQAVSADLVITGHGWGHGRGMGQYGALGYALDYGWTHQQILAHFYGGSTLSTDPTNQVIRVELTRRQDLDAIVTGSQLRVNGVDLPGVTAVRLGKSVSSSSAVHLWTTTQPQAANPCAGPWTDTNQEYAATIVGSVIVGTGANSEVTAGMLRVCNADANQPQTAYRGELEVIRSSAGTQYLLNRVFDEDYLRGVIPRESPASWGDLGGGAGMAALRAQSVAARSYVLASSRPASGATSCDTDSCQVYGGAAVFSGAGVLTKTLEDARTDAAVAQTANAVMRLPSGAIARTEFSSSTGGYTAGGTFTAVPDLGDTRSPNHDWSVTMSMSAVAAGLGTGPIARIGVAARNGLGADGGRVTSVLVTLTDGSTRSFTGNQVRVALGLKSDWFSFRNQQYCQVPGGYWMTSATGHVYGLCDATEYGSAPPLAAGSPVVTMAATPSGSGYWLVASDGGVFSFGDAAFYGSTGAIKLNKPIVTAMATPSGGGYWLVASDGGVFTFGDAAFYGSTGAIRLNQPIVTAMATPSGRGYWLIASDGGVFTFGDATFSGSTGAMRLNKPIVTAMPTPSGAGYWLVASDGGVFTFGDAVFRGSTGAIALVRPIVGAAATTTGAGYWMFASDGGVFTFGDATYHGSLGDLTLDSPIVAAARP